MTLADWNLICMGLLTACGLAGCVLCWKLADKDGYARGVADEYARQARRRAGAGREQPGQARGRHHRSQPRQGGRAAPSLPARPPWEQAAPPRPGRVVTASGERAPVTVFPVGDAAVPYRHQPSNISGASTVRMPALTDTGEIRAIGERMREELAERAERDRQEMIRS